VVREESAAILLGECPGKPEFSPVVKRPHVVELDFEEVTGLGTVYVNGSCKVVDLCEVYVTNLIRVVVVFDLAASPVESFQA